MTRHIVGILWALSLTVYVGLYCTLNSILVNWRLVAAFHSSTSTVSIV